MKILSKSQKEMPGIKAIPVPVEEEAPEATEPAEEKPETPDAKEEPQAQIEPPKRKRRTKAEIEKEKAEKAMKKAEKEQEKVDLKARVKCPNLQERTHECPHTLVQAYVR